MKKIVLIAVVFTFLFSSLAYASDTWSDPRVKMIIHGKKEINDYLDLTVNFIPSGNLIGELRPNLYLGTKFNLGKGFYLEPTIGWCFTHEDDSPVISLRPAYTDDNFLFWFTIDYSHWPQDQLYAMMLNEYKLFKFVMIGVEYEGWGGFKSEERSDGVGPNILLIYKPIRIDLAIRYRHFNNDETGFELATRFHIFF